MSFTISTKEFAHVISVLYNLMDIHADNAMETLKCMSKLSVGLEILSYGMDALGRWLST